MATTVTAFQFGTLIVAIIGLVFAVASLAWNVAQFLLTGGRPKVELIIGALTETGVIVLPVTPRMHQELDRLAERNGYTEQVIGAVITNAGRGPATVERWGFLIGKATYWVGSESLGDSVPVKMDAGGGKVTTVAPIGRIKGIADTIASAERAVPRVRVIVELGNGKSVRSKQSMTFPAEQPAAS